MDEMAQQAAFKGQVDSFLVERSYITNPQLCASFFDSSLSRRLASKLSPVVRKAFYSALPKTGSYKTRGIQLAPQRFADAIAGQSAVFKDAPIRRQPVADVHIAVDCSLSMEGTGEPSESPMLVANTAVYGLAKTLYQLPSINVQVDYFSSYKKVCFYRACPFSQSPVQRNFAVKPFGSTPTGEAIRKGTEQLLKKRRGGESNYLVMILDGELPDDDSGKGIRHIDGMLSLARQIGTTVFCIILSPFQQEAFQRGGFKAQECIFIDDAHQLPTAFETLVQQSLFNR